MNSLSSQVNSKKMCHSGRLVIDSLSVIGVNWISPGNHDRILSYTRQSEKGRPEMTAVETHFVLHHSVRSRCRRVSADASCLIIHDSMRKFLSNKFETLCPNTLTKYSVILKCGEPRQRLHLAAMAISNWEKNWKKEIFRFLVSVCSNLTNQLAKWLYKNEMEPFQMFFYSSFLCLISFYVKGHVFLICNWQFSAVQLHISVGFEIIYIYNSL